MGTGGKPARPSIETTLSIEPADGGARPPGTLAIGL